MQLLRQRRRTAKRSRKRLGRYDYKAALRAILISAASGGGSADERLRRVIDYAERLFATDVDNGKVV